jgi:hypothetical protein
LRIRYNEYKALADRIKTHLLVDTAVESMGLALRQRYHQLRHSSKGTPPMADSTIRAGNLKNPFISLLQALNMDFFVALPQQVGLPR